MCLDDLHWMDRPTVDALAFVARRIAAERVVLLCTSRSRGQLLGDEQVVTWIELAGLSGGRRARPAALARAGPRLGAAQTASIAQAGGNPLALVEFASALERGQSAWTELDDETPDDAPPGAGLRRAGRRAGAGDPRDRRRGCPRRR